MKWKSEVLAATKQFAKDVGTMDAIVCGMASEQLSSGVKQFCNGNDAESPRRGHPMAK